MATIENNLLLQTINHQETSDSHMQSLNELDLNNPDMLRTTIDRINAMHVSQYNPVRFRFIESMADKALEHRRSVADIIEKKALQALSDYVKEYIAFQKCTVPDNILLNGQKNSSQGRLAKLTQEMFQSSDTDGLVSKPSLEDELRLQEKEVMHSISGTMTGKHIDNFSNNINNSNSSIKELSVMRHFRQSQAKHNSEKLLTRIIQEGPDDAGPLNSQALIIRSLTIMSDLSPDYISRFVSYMDTLLWLEQAGEEGATKKRKNKSRR